MIVAEEDPYDIQLAMQRAPGASHSNSRVVLVENLSPSTSISGLLRHFQGFAMQDYAATLLDPVHL